MPCRKVQGLQAEVEEQEAKLRELRDVAACIAADVQRAQDQNTLRLKALLYLMFISARSN